MCEVQGDAWLSPGSHYLSSSTPTSSSAMQHKCEIWANGWCERQCICLSASGSPSPSLTRGSPGLYVDWLPTGEWQIQMEYKQQHVLQSTDMMKNDDWEKSMISFMDGWLHSTNMHTRGHRALHTNLTASARTEINTHPFMHTDCHTTAFFSLSKVWLHIVTTVSLLRICLGT